MDIIFHHPLPLNAAYLVEPSAKSIIPEAAIRQWQAGDNNTADYSVVWHPPVEMLSARKGLKAVLIPILSKLKDIQKCYLKVCPLFRLEDTGMGPANAGVCSDSNSNNVFGSLFLITPFEDFTIGILGGGVTNLGQVSCRNHCFLGFSCALLSRSHKNYPNIRRFADDLLAALEIKRENKGAMLDVLYSEPLVTLFCRTPPQDALLAPLMTVIRDEQDDLLIRLQNSVDLPELTNDFTALFIGDECRVSPYRSAWEEGTSEEDVRQFFNFTSYLLPWCGAFLGKVEAHAATAFYRTLAILSREAIQAMRDELQEHEKEYFVFIKWVLCHSGGRLLCYDTALLKTLLPLALTTAILSEAFGVLSLELGLLAWAGFLGLYRLFFLILKVVLKGCLFLYLLCAACFVGFGFIHGSTLAPQVEILSYV
ncbi:unnamed protein product [Ranitomeya imitator]|uniref:Uncharacterized protein n=1 Tax=Ranitomeya imitator TaxID=111125 RepID=A0ABN9LPJ5_9NEOB|nr:unnamed protein product [Ranitomeya imitator]